MNETVPNPAAASEPVLEIAGLNAALKSATGERRLVLRGIDLALQAGEIHGLVGESGAGKSMIARALLGILPRAVRITAGQARFRGEDLLRLAPARRRALMGRQIALIPQDPLTALNPSRRIAAQMTDVMRRHLRLDRGQAIARARGLLREVRIREPESVLRRYPHELSGGMRQRVLIATAFACEPALIVADEPTTALDATVQKQILRLLRAMQHRHGTAVLFVSHDLGAVSKLCGRLSVIHSGMIVEQGETAGIVADPRHAFTRALFAATPRHDRPGDSLAPVPDAVIAELERAAAAFDRAPGAGG